jgi:lysyl-tRNA synthetase class 2
MADERELIEEREKKAAELRALGLNPYANGFAPTHTTARGRGALSGVRAVTPPPGPAPATQAGTDARQGLPAALLSDERFSVAGRIVAYRGFGGAAFVKLLDRGGELQVWIKKDVVGEAAFEAWKKLERGDFIGATGARLCSPRPAS